MCVALDLVNFFAWLESQSNVSKQSMQLWGHFSCYLPKSNIRVAGTKAMQLWGQYFLPWTELFRFSMKYKPVLRGQ